MVYINYDDRRLDLNPAPQFKCQAVFPGYIYKVLGEI